MRNRAGVILTALLLALLCGCAPARPAAVYQNPIDFYYCDLEDPHGGALGALAKQTVDLVDPEITVEEILTRYLAGPDDPALAVPGRPDVRERHDFGWCALRPLWRSLRGAERYPPVADERLPDENAAANSLCGKRADRDGRRNADDADGDSVYRGQLSAERRLGYAAFRGGCRGSVCRRGRNGKRIKKRPVHLSWRTGRLYVSDYQREKSFSSSFSSARVSRRAGTRLSGS